MEMRSSARSGFGRRVRARILGVQLLELMRALPTRLEMGRCKGVYYGEFAHAAHVTRVVMREVAADSGKVVKIQ